MKKKKKASKMYIIIPNDIIIQILVRLPAKYVFKLRCVCKYWFNLISDPVFIKMHLHHHQHDQTNYSILVFDYGPSADQTLLHSLNYNNNSIDKWISTHNPINYMPLGSCNGLLCIFTSRFLSSCNRIRLLNPCTKQYKELPQLDHEQVVPPTYEFAHSTYGFGYDRINDDYKVVKNFTQYVETLEGSCDFKTVINVYTLGTNSWRRIEDLLPYKLKDVEGVLVGGVLYWRAEKSLDHYVIVGFQLGDEVHKEISFPPSCAQCEHMLELNGCFSRFHGMLELNGCLSIFQRTVHNTIEAWTLMNSDDDWVHLFTIAEPKLLITPYLYGYSMPIGICNEDGELLMKLKNKKLVWYNPRDGKIRFFAKIPKKDCRSYRLVVRYTESLVSP